MIEITLKCPIRESFRVAQIGGMFDVPIEGTSTRTIRFEEPPGADEVWKVGLIAGPSGSGKSTVAKHLYPDDIYSGNEWPCDQAVIDGFGDMPVKEITRLLTAVGFSSPPSWLKPYRVLSNGEKFRCDLAKALLLGISKAARSSYGVQPVVFDEYTSVVDRNVAKIASAAISKRIKSGEAVCRFVGVTCHYDVTDWLEPDWVLDMATGTIARRSLRRPPIKLEIYRCSLDAWRLFVRHHYLSAKLHHSAQCYMAVWNDIPVGFCGLLASRGHKGIRRVSRIVTLPDYQGVGIGGRFLDEMGFLQQQEGYRLSIVGSHPSIIAHCKTSPKWRYRKLGEAGFENASCGRAVLSFEYAGG